MKVILRVHRKLGISLDSSQEEVLIISQVTGVTPSPQPTRDSFIITPILSPCFFLSHISFHLNCPVPWSPKTCFWVALPHAMIGPRCCDTTYIACWPHFILTRLDSDPTCGAAMAGSQVKKHESWF